MSRKDASVLICGLPGSGKSTYLAALGHLINSGEVATTLKEQGLPEDRAYLNQLTKNWLRCEALERTRSGQIHSIELLLGDETEAFRIDIPDSSGEMWRDEFFCHRECPAAVGELIQRSTGVVFFLHADAITPPVPISTANSMDGTDAARNSDELEDWAPERHVPTQSMVVELLQLLARPPLALGPRRLAFVLSAWDLAIDANLSPAAYLARELPLLHQYLESGFHYSEYKIYGVSALGGDLSEKAEELAARAYPTDRIIVVPSEQAPHRDLTHPIKWVLSSR